MSPEEGKAPVAAPVSAEPDVITFVDEAGPRGFLRDLKPASDAGVSVLCGLPIPARFVDGARTAIRPLYERFRDAAPPGAKIHITDAFKPGNEAWGAVARPVREELFAYLQEKQYRIVYSARRLRVARETYEMNTRFKEDLREAKASRGPSNIVVPGANRPSDEQVDDRLLKDLTLVMDMFMEIEELKWADFNFDEITDTAADRFRKLIEELRHTGDSVHATEVRDLSKGQSFERSMRLKTEITSHPGQRLNVEYVRGVTKVGKADPLIFAVDVVTNSLWRHLDALEPTADLNDAAALTKWPLAGIVSCLAPAGHSIFDRM